MRLRAADIGLDVVSDHPCKARFGIECGQRRLEVGSRRLAEHDRLRIGGVFEPGHECASVQKRSVLGLPPAVLVQRVELRAGLELVEGAGQVHIAEDEIALRGLVGAADEHRLRVLADELDPFQLADDRVHRQCEDSAAGERLGRRSRRRLQLLVVELDPHCAQFLRRAPYGPWSCCS